MPGSKPLQVGVTGGIGSGKSTVCEVFSTLDVPCYNADQAAKDIMRTDPELVEGIISKFGQESYLESGEINRDYLARIVFSDKDKINELNALVHPAVARHFASWIIDHQNYPYIIKEAALLIESGSYKSLDRLINVIAPIEIRIDRVKRRDPFRSRNEILNIIKNQLSDEARIDKSDYLIKNDDADMLIPQVLQLDATFRGMD